MRDGLCDGSRRKVGVRRSTARTAAKRRCVIVEGYDEDDIGEKLKITMPTSSA